MATQLPEVWASHLPIKVLWRATATGNDLSTVESRLREFNNRLYDCTDGQWRVRLFLIHDDRSELSSTGKGVGHVHRTGTHGAHGHRDGRPNNPEHWEVNETSSVGAYLMEFLHSWTGLLDEYEVNQGGARTNCPATEALRNSSNACVMDGTAGTPTELCRPGTHNANTEQGNVRGMDCYSWLRKVMHEAGHTGFQVPSDHIAGPTTAPTLRFVYLTIQRVKQIDDPDPGVLKKTADYYARVRMSGCWFERSQHQDNRADVSPNWVFGLGFSNDSHRKIPIRIEIWDHDWLDSDDLCDTSPVKGRKALEISYDTATGRITGDVTGTRDAPVTVRGAGEADRAEITFVITSR
ncbi:MAG: hypothetical protein HY671_14455 [Chloroflexi bacterium]|nr:hypothetical protein [Chloroflexota bacterium]